MLHTVNKSPFERNTLTACLGHALPESAVLLIEDGVYAAMNGTAFEKDVRKAMEDRTLYVLGPDLLARGLTADQVIDGIQVVDYEGFVELTEKHDKVQAWL
ncbi:sulfurtransferase TusB [Thioalkalivibrio denitrificans]|uniref:Sulfurtransferase TusB n=1 Tax=Thioalkalivibrio denitrificans TaxID=108003 RepID=A0A1V3NCG5_9GAMM|nr:sulfurtransferase complex subunit TusB [Thioalkalivibrio denitrificans]OOG22466.1 sulfurtransferase TusB [Thioalkalivibrio denitrificans]